MKGRSAMRTVYGPVYSPQFGMVLGVDMVASHRKYCTYDCIYCQSARRTHGVARRRQFVGMSAVQAMLESFQPSDADYVVFAGMGEPTLASNLGEAMELAKAVLGLPVAVLTNSSLLPKEDVRRDLLKADMVVAKVDAPNDELYQQINRPFVPFSMREILGGLEQFAGGFAGKLVIQPTIIAENSAVAGELAAICRKLSPCQVQLNTPVACPAEVSMVEMERIRGDFVDMKTLSVYETRKPERRSLSLGLPPLRPNAEVMLMAWAT